MLKLKDTKPIPLHKSVIDWHFNLLNSLSRCYIYISILSEKLPTTIEINKNSALTQIHNTLFLTFINQWCMIFGNENKNQTHWKRALIKNVKDTKGNTIIEHYEFCSIIIKNLKDKANITANEFKQAKRSVTESRNTFTAHIDIENLHEMARIKIPYTIAQKYSNLISNIDIGDGFSHTPIEEREEFVSEEINSILS